MGSLDFALDEADRAAGRRIACPVRAALRRAQRAVAAWYDVLSVWREWADDVRGRALDSGPYLAEEAPEETARDLRALFAK